MTAQQENNNNNQAAMQQLQSIQAKANDVAHKLRERLPAQRTHLAAAVAAWKWLLHMRAQMLQPQEYSAVYAMAVKKMRMELGAFDYQAREQAELLTRYLCDLDNILSHGDAEVKAARKALVVTIQELLQEADAMKVQSSKLKAWGERMIERFPVQAAVSEPAPEPMPVDENVQSETTEEMEAEEVSNENTEEITAAAEDAEVANEEEMDEEDESDSEDENDLDADENDRLQPESVKVDDGDIITNDADDQQVAEDVSQPKFQRPSQSTAPQPSVADEAANNSYYVDIQSLPVWRPYFQIQKRRDGVYLIANLRGINKEHVNIECEPNTGLLRISGFKLPTRKDIIMSQWSGAPTFGRFEIVERFPARMLNMAEATQLLRADGTLEIRLPYYMVQYPRYIRQPTTSFFAPERCAVW